MSESHPTFLNLAPENIGSEHICCAIAGAQHREGVERKKEFLAQGFGHGLVFRKADVRGKVFIEYAPAETAWRPVVAPGYLVIHCLWVSGRYKGSGFGKELLDHCLAESGAGYHGVVSVAGRSPYLTDTSFYLHHGFEVVETTAAGYDLVCYRANSETMHPRFADNASRGTVPLDKGVHFEYVFQCPFVPGCLREMKEVADNLGLCVTERELTLEGAQNAASPFGTFGAFLYGRLITHELMSSAKFRGLLEAKLSLGKGSS